MSTQHMVGQLFMVGIPLPDLDAQTRSLLHDLQPGGVILFRRNYIDPETLTALCTEIHSLFPDSPPLIALDHEGGRVHRLSPPFTHFPAAANLGRTHSTTLAYRVGYAMGQELQRVSIDINFAPVLDVLTNPDNTVIGDRAFAGDPHVVAQFGCALVRGLREGGVIPCGKHFPGHGGTFMDSHEDLPHDGRSEDELLRIDLYPFRQAIAENIEMIMTAHVLYPAFDPDLPATLSPRIIDGLLRHQLGFQGVVVSDDLEMGAIVRHSTVEQAAVDALNAGADLLLICHNLQSALAARDACIRALENGALALQRVEQARQHIATLKKAHPTRQLPAGGSIDSQAHAMLVDEILRAVS